MLVASMNYWEKRELNESSVKDAHSVWCFEMSAKFLVCFFLQHFPGGALPNGSFSKYYNLQIFSKFAFCGRVQIPLALLNVCYIFESFFYKILKTGNITDNYAVNNLTQIIIYNCEPFNSIEL